jgi:hypothetical protein
LRFSADATVRPDPSTGSGRSGFQAIDNIAETVLRSTA